MKVLLIEDNNDTVDRLQVRYPDVLVISADSGANVKELLEHAVPRLIILDCGAFSASSIDAIRMVRERSEVPLLVVSESFTDFDCARWLEAGANECMSKPYTSVEFLARCNALLCRGTPCDSKPASPEVLTVDFDAREVFLCGERVRLTPIEYELLSELVRNAGRVVARDYLLERVWGQEYRGDLNLVKIYVYRLRTKLEAAGLRGRLIMNERGFGYRIAKDRVAPGGPEARRESARHRDRRTTGEPKFSFRSPEDHWLPEPVATSDCM